MIVYCVKVEIINYRGEILMTQNDFWQKLKKRLKEVSTAAADFTEEQALIGKLKFEILTLKRKVDRLNSNLGMRVCEISRQSPHPDPLEDSDVNGFISDIADLEIQIENKRLEITGVADHFRSKATEAKSKPKPGAGEAPFPLRDEEVVEATPPKEPVAVKEPVKPKKRKYTRRSKTDAKPSSASAKKTPAKRKYKKRTSVKKGKLSAKPKQKTTEKSESKPKSTGEEAKPAT